MGRVSFFSSTVVDHSMKRAEHISEASYFQNLEVTICDDISSCWLHWIRASSSRCLLT